MTPIDDTMPATDSAGDVFDPELHAAKPDGTPAVKTDGTFRKKRRDAGRGRSASPLRPAKASTAGVPRALQEQRARHVKGVQTTAAAVLTPLSFISPVDAFTLADLVDPLAESLADYAPENSQVAAALDKLSAGGGAFAVLAVVGMGVLQVMHNHGKVPETVARMAGIRPLSETQRLFAQRAEAAQRAAAEVADEAA